ncbi:MAG: phosphate-starvation-inducible PsiE family protein [Erythrobacter sp.]|jgi:protein PsiE|nr:phosphate-starvation-inducible PsiE family protein [Erythrobacter sp.]
MTEPSQQDDASRTPPLADRTFKTLEHALLIIATAMTLAAVVAEVLLVFEKRSVDLADILLMFLYTEVLAMIAIFYTGRGSFFVFPIFIAITALARLIVLQGKDMAPQNVLFEAGAIFLLAIAALVMGRVKSE